MVITIVMRIFDTEKNKNLINVNQCNISKIYSLISVKLGNLQGFMIVF